MRFFNFGFMSEKSKSLKARAAESLKLSTNLETRRKCRLEPGLKTLGLPQTPGIRRTVESKAPEQFCSKTGEGCCRRASASDKHRARSRSRSRSPLLHR